MSQANVELSLLAIEEFNRRDLEAMLALMADDVETVSRLVAMEGPYHGHDGYRRWWENLLGAYPDLSVEVVEARDLGDFTLTHQRLRGRSAGSGAPVEEPRWVVHEWRDGKIVWWSSQYSVESDALEAVGLRE
jgi:ketosteroid isomerase-like protein